MYGLRQNQAEGRQRDKDDYGISSPATQMIMIYVGTGKTWRTLKKHLTNLVIAVGFWGNGRCMMETVQLEFGDTKSRCCRKTKGILGDPHPQM